MSSSMRDVALKIIQQSKPLLEATYVAANVADYQHLDLAFYKTLQSSLEKQGFSFVADWSILEVANSPNSLIAKTFN